MGKMERRGSLCLGFVVGTASIWGLVSCGRTPVPAAGVRGEVAGYVIIGQGLKSSRVARAGCIQLVQKDGLVAEFSWQGCPANVRELLPREKTVLSLTVDTSIKEKIVLRKDGVSVGVATDPQTPEGGLPQWTLRHLCQISDPTITPQPVFAEVCAVEFEQEEGDKLGTYKGIRITPLEDLALRKLEEAVLLRQKANESAGRTVQLETSQENLRREMELARVDRQHAREAYAEAQLGLRDAMASRQTVHRGLEGARAQADLELTLRQERYLEVYIKLAESNQRLAEFLKERLEASEWATKRNGEIQKLLDHYAKAGISKSEEQEQLTSYYKDNEKVILSKPQKEKFETERTLALAEAEKIPGLRTEQHAALLLIVEKKDECIRLDRLPATDVEEIRAPKTIEE